MTKRKVCPAQQHKRILHLYILDRLRCIMLPRCSLLPPLPLPLPGRREQTGAVHSKRDLRKMDFEALLSKIDMMPPLWPSGPKWPTDDRLLDQLLSEPPLSRMGGGGGMMKMMLGAAKDQRVSDERWRHFKCADHPPSTRWGPFLTCGSVVQPPQGPGRDSGLRASGVVLDWPLPRSGLAASPQHQRSH